MQANNSLPLLMDSLNSTYDISIKMTEVGAGRTQISKDSMKVGVEKVTSKMLKDRGAEADLDGVKLGFEINETTGDPIEIKVIQV